MNYSIISERDNSISAIEQVLINRGIADCEGYLNTTDEDLIEPDEKNLYNLKAGAKMLINHIAQNDRAFVQVDVDTDGFTSSALLLNYLHELFPTYVENQIIYDIHTEKVHGIYLDEIPEDVKLVIIPDAGSNQYEEHEVLAARGVDVLVLDHHHAEYPSPYACVINNQLSPYSNKNLSGVGIVYKFCHYLDTLLQTDIAENYLDLVALGNVADMMSLKEKETKRLIEKGLANIKNPFFNSLAEKNAYSLGNTITPFGVSFYIAPFINATTRVGTKEERILLFESMLDYKAFQQVPSTKRGHQGEYETLVEQAVRTCVNVKNRQKRAQEASAAILDEIIQTNNLNENKIIMVRVPETMPIEKSLTGLAANEIASKYQKPTLILNEKEDNWSGSGRNYDKGDFKQFREYLVSTNLFNFCEGHSSAFGAEINKDKIENFIKRSNQDLASFSFVPEYKVDFAYDFNQLNEMDILSIADHASLWGQEVEEPLMLITNVRLTKNNCLLMKGSTLKITTDSDINFIKFGFKQEEYDLLVNDTGYTSINIVGYFKKNEWNGFVNPQIQIVDYEIANQIKYYF